MSSWDDLTRELDAWAALRQKALLWWRDDDAAHLTPALKRLLKLQAAAKVPLLLAAVPATLTESAAHAMRRAKGADGGVAVAQHGYAHANHAPEGEKKAELGAHRPVTEMLDELRVGKARLETLLGTALHPILVPPWNRMDPALGLDLPSLGFRGLSAYGPDDSNSPPSLCQVNTHVDFIDWRGSRGFRGEAVVLDEICDQLVDRRRGARGDEAMGLLTHHQIHDPAAWLFLDRLFAATTAHKGARWLSAGEVFGI